MRAEAPLPTTLVELIRQRAKAQPAVPAIVCARETGEHATCTFGELWRMVERFAAGLLHHGLVRGTRVVLLAPLSPELYALVLAMMGSGVTAVFLDSAIRSRKGFTHVLRTAEPRALVTTPKLARMRVLFPRLWRATVFTTGQSAFGRPLCELAQEDAPAFTPLAFAPRDEAFVSFTSGSTGLPKGVNRTQGVTLGQHLRIQATKPQEPGEAHLTPLPVLALHNLACGVSTILPALNPAAPSTEGLDGCLALMTQYKVSRISGAPRFVTGLAERVLARGHDVERVRQIVTGAAPVTKTMCELILKAFPHAQCDIAYGSTEAEPVSMVSMQDVLASTGRGYLVGQVAAQTELEIVRLPEDLSELGPEGIAPYRVAPGEEGELIVRGEQVVESYLAAPEANRKHKLRAPDGSVYHRLGDVGYRDSQGRIWLTGRTHDLVPRPDGALAPLPVEAQLEQAARGVRTAFIAHKGAPHGELVYASEAHENDAAPLLRARLDALGLRDVPLVRVSALPFDPRHGSKLDRPTLRAQREALS